MGQKRDKDRNLLLLLSLLDAVTCFSSKYCPILGLIWIYTMEVAFLKKIISVFFAYIFSQVISIALGYDIIAQGPPPRVTVEILKTLSEKEYWQSRVPYNDATDALNKKDYRLFFIPHGMGYGEIPGIICITRPDRQYFFVRGIISDARTGKEQILYEKALRKYASTYNFIVASSPDFPLIDYCKSKPSPYIEGPGGTSDFRTPTGPSTLSMIGAIRRRDIKTIKKFKRDGKAGYPRILGLSSSSWAALVGDEEIFTLLYNPEIHTPLLASKRNVTNSIVDFAAIGGNTAITLKLLKNGHKPRLMPERFDGPSLASFISPAIFDLLMNSLNYDQKTVSDFSNAAIRDQNDELAWHILKHKLIPNEAFLKQANKYGATFLLTRYLTAVGIKQFEKDFSGFIDRVTRDPVIKFLYNQNISGDTISELLGKPVPENRYSFYQNFYKTSFIKLTSFKRIYQKYGLAPHLAILASLENQDLQFLHQLLAKKKKNGELTAKYKTGLFTLFVFYKIPASSPVFRDFDITFEDALDENPCELISNRFGYLGDSQKQAAIEFVIRTPEHLTKCSQKKSRFNIRSLMLLANDDQLEKLISSTQQTNSMSKEDGIKILSNMTIPILRFKSGDFAQHLINSVYQHNPTQKTLKWMKTIVARGPDTDAMRLLFELGLSAAETDDPRYIGIFRAANLGNLEQIKAYIDYGEDKYRVSPNEGPLPLFACLKIGVSAQSLYESGDPDCTTGLSLRKLQKFIIQKNKKAVCATLEQLTGQWTSLRGWHQTILKALISQNMYDAAIMLSKEFPTPDSWRMEREISDEYPYGGLNDNLFWNDRKFYNNLPFQDLLAVAFQTQDISLITAVLEYYSGIVRLNQYESLSNASVYITPETYEIFQQALKHHNITTKYHRFGTALRPYLTRKYLNSGNETKIVAMLKTYLIEHKIKATKKLLDSIKNQGIKLKHRHKDMLASLAESIGQFGVSEQILEP